MHWKSPYQTGRCRAGAASASSGGFTEKRGGRKNSRTIYRLAAVLLMLALCAVQCSGFTVHAQETDAGTLQDAQGGGTEAFGLHNPVVEEDSSMVAGQKTTWDCVWFGSYPQAEVGDSEMVLNGRIDDMRAEDVIIDKELYEALEAASGWDSNNEIILDGQKFRRIEEKGVLRYFKYEPIKWRVLQADGGRALLLSDRALDCQQYYPEYEFITWEASTIRSWLNGYSGDSNKTGTDYRSGSFIGSAFSTAEKQAVTGSGDPVFFLSEEETFGERAAAYGFVSKPNEEAYVNTNPGHLTYDEARCCRGSAYAKALGVFTREGQTTSGIGQGNCYYWLRSPDLRSPGEEFRTTPAVEYDSWIDSETVNASYIGVRPALYLDLSSNQWSAAGTVCSDGTKDEVPWGSGEEGYKSLNDAEVTFASKGDNEYTGEPQCPEFTVIYDGKELVEGKDYTVSCTNNVNPSYDPYCVECYGTIYDNIEEKYAKISITGKYPYKDTIEQYFLISGFFDLTAVRQMDYNPAYTGGEVCPKPEIVLYDDGKMDTVLTENVDYSISYENNTEPGNATAVVTGIGKYAGYGSYHIHFTIGQAQDGGETEQEDGVNRFTYRFGNTEQDFGYEPGYKIDEKSIFTKLWGNTELAETHYNYWTKEVGDWDGNCYGMAASSIMFNDSRDDIEISGFNSGAAFVKELELSDYNRNSNIRMSLLDFIEVMQVSQTDDTIAAFIKQTNKGRINWLCNALKSAEENHTGVIIVLDSGTSAGPGAHALVGYRMEDVSGTERRIYVYDCNHPGESRYITLTMKDGACTGWSYDGSSESRRLYWSSGLEGGTGSTISFINYDNFVKVWLNRSLEEKPASDRNVMTLNVANASICDKDGNEVAELKDGEVYSEDGEIFSYYPVGTRLDGGAVADVQPMIYLPTDEYVVKNTDETAGELQLTMCNVDRKINVITSASSVSVNVSDAARENTVRVEGAGETVEATFSSSDTSEPYKSMNYIGSVIGTSIMTLGASDGEKVLENFQVVSETEESKEPDGQGDNQGSQDDQGNQGSQSGNQGGQSGQGSQSGNQGGNQGSQDGQGSKNQGNVSFELISAAGSKSIAAGKKVRLKTVTTPANAKAPKLTYSSSDKKTATVSRSGVVSMKKNAGGRSVVITAKAASGRKASIKLKVMKGAVKRIQISGKKSCRAGKSIKLKAKVTAGRGANKKVLWKSSNTRYATVSKNGVVTAKKKGKGKKVKITAAATDGSGKKKSVTVTIK